MLSAPVEGLIAKMDLVDIQAGIAIPVDYKHGRVPDIPGQAWEPERVQLCAQGLILRENGYLVEGGILYYVDSRKRISVPFDEELVDRTRELIQELRATAARHVMPPPLVDSPKCPRCSLVGICLPDETRLLQLKDQRSEVGSQWSEVGDQRSEVGDLGSEIEDHGPQIRRLMPARDDALPLYVKEQGATLGKSGDELTVKSRQATLQTVKLIDTSQVSIFGNVQVTAQAVRELTSAGIPLCHFSYGGWFNAVTVGMIHKNVELRIAQFAAAADPGRSLALARQFVLGKIKNCRTLLRRHMDEGGRRKGEGGREDAETAGREKTEGGRRKDEGGNGEAVDFHSETQASQPRPSSLVSPKSLTLRRLDDLMRKAESAVEAASLLGIEGMAAKEYFAGFALLLDGGETFNIENRNRRPPRDPVNALLSFVYSLLVKEWTLTLYATGFDPLLGFYHRPRYGRPSLALDLAEEFRPLVADSTVLMLINNGEVSAESFIQRAGAVALTDAGRRSVIAAFERRMETLVTHPLFGYRISYRRIFEVQARLLGRVLLGEISEYPNFCTR
jgi:CRISPR-associated protein Cas1